MCKLGLKISLSSCSNLSLWSLLRQKEELILWSTGCVWMGFLLLQFMVIEHSRYMFDDSKESIQLIICCAYFVEVTNLCFFNLYFRSMSPSFFFIWLLKLQSSYFFSSFYTTVFIWAWYSISYLWHSLSWRVISLLVASYGYVIS